MKSSRAAAEDELGMFLLYRVGHGKFFSLVF